MKGTWPEYTTYLGGELSSHGAGIATVRPDPAGANHPLLAGLDTARYDEEWYAYKTNPRLTPNVTVLYFLDEKSCNNCPPIMGHMDHIFQKDALPRTLYRQALDWAAGATVSVFRADFSRPVGSGLSYRVSGPMLEVNLTGAGGHVLSIGTLDGRKVTRLSGRGPARYAIPILKARTLYTLTATTDKGSSTRLVP